jgi:integrase
VLGVAWGDFDFEANTVSFTYQLDAKGHRVPLKTPRSRRSIEVTPGLVAALRKARLAAPANHSANHDFVFLCRAGRPRPRATVDLALDRAFERAKLESVERDGVVVLPRPTFHDLRHTHASALIAAGLDIEQVSARLGHANVAVTMLVYTHEYDKGRRSDVVRSKLAEIYEGVASGG